MKKVYTLIFLLLCQAIILNARQDPQFIEPGSTYRNNSKDSQVVVSIPALSAMIAESKRNSELNEKQKLLVSNLEQQLVLYKEDQLNRRNEISYWKAECFRLNDKLEELELEALHTKKKHRRNTMLMIFSCSVIYSLTLLLR